MSVTGTSRFGVSAILIALMAAVAGLAPSSPVSGGQATGVIQGKVKVASPPTPGTLETTTDQAVCGESVPDETVVADASGGVANAVVTVGGVPWPEGATVLVISNSGCRFVPHVQVARRPSTLQLTSEDQTLHTTHAYDDRNRTLFNVAIPLPGISIERPLQRPGIVRLECDSHAWMRGYVVVTDEVAATTGPNGRFTLEWIPVGTYELSVWHEKLHGASQKVTVSAGATTDVAFMLE